MKDIVHLLKSNFNLQSNYFRYAIRLTISCSLTVLLYKSLHLPNGYWAAFSVLACVWPTLGLALQRSQQRIMGTFLGMWLGILIAHSFFGYHLVMIDILIPVFIFFAFYAKPFNYALFSLLTTIITVLFICLLIPGDWQVAIIRLAWTVLGTVIALVATFYIFPSHAARLIPEQLLQARQSLQDYYVAICSNYQSLKDKNIRNNRSITYTNLQILSKTLEEYRIEVRYLSNKERLPLDFKDNLDAIYQNLLLLDIHLPIKIENPSLNELLKSIQPILEHVKPLFISFDEGVYSNISTQVSQLLNQVKQQRIAKTSDFTIESVTFYDHMQVTCFLETLQILLTEVWKNSALYRV